jgi:hypothetical protein
MFISWPNWLAVCGVPLHVSSLEDPPLHGLSLFADQ